MGNVDPSYKTELLVWEMYIRLTRQIYMYEKCKSILQDRSTCMRNVDPSYKTNYIYGIVMEEKKYFKSVCVNMP